MPEPALSMSVTPSPALSVQSVSVAPGLIHNMEIGQALQVNDIENDAVMSLSLKTEGAVDYE